MVRFDERKFYSPRNRFLRKRNLFAGGLGWISENLSNYFNCWESRVQRLKLCEVEPESHSLCVDCLKQFQIPPEWSASSSANKIHLRFETKAESINLENLRSDSGKPGLEFRSVLRRFPIALFFVAGGLWLHELIQVQAESWLMLDNKNRPGDSVYSLVDLDLLFVFSFYILVGAARRAQASLAVDFILPFRDVYWLEYHPAGASQF